MKLIIYLTILPQAESVSFQCIVSMGFLSCLGGPSNATLRHTNNYVPEVYITNPRPRYMMPLLAWMSMTRVVFQTWYVLAQMATA